MSTCSRVEKKVERSGRRGGWEAVLVVGAGTLCSTGGRLAGLGGYEEEKGWTGGVYLRRRTCWVQRNVVRRYGR